MLTPVRSNLRQRTLEAALAVLRRDGWPGVTMRAVGEEAGVTAAALYRHFENKEELWGELVREVGALFRDYVHEGQEGGSPADRLWGALDALRRFAVEEPMYYGLLMETGSGDGGRTYPERYRDNPARSFRMLRDLVRACMDDGSLREDDPVDVAITLASHGHGLIRLYRLGRFGSDRAAFTEFYRASFGRLVHGLGGERRGDFDAR